MIPLICTFYSSSSQKSKEEKGALYFSHKSLLFGDKAEPSSLKGKLILLFINMLDTIDY
jgi:hypothetical protein